MDASSLLSFIILAIIIGLIAWVGVWAIGYLGIPEPIAKVATVIIVLLAVLIILFQGAPMLGVSI